MKFKLFELEENIRINKLGAMLFIIHAAIWVGYFIFVQFISKDPESGMLIIFLVFLNPPAWLAFWLAGQLNLHPHDSLLFLFVVILGSFIWYIIGSVINVLYQHINGTNRNKVP